MNLSVSRCRLGLLAGLALLLGPLAAPSQGGLIPSTYNAIFGTGGYGYGGGYTSYYAPAAYGYSGGYGYTANYGGYGYGGGCCLSRLFHGCGLFGCARPSYAAYAPSYSGPCCAPAACGSCGSCDSCGNAGYALSGLCGDGCASGDCGISSGESITPVVPYSGDPVPSAQPRLSPGATPPQTYKEPGGDGFTKPIPGTNDPAPADGGGGMVLPGQGGAASGSPDTGITPAGGTTPDSSVERGDGFQFESFKIPAKDHQDTTPATDETESDADAATPEESRLIKPLHVDTKIAVHSPPQRRRAHYRVVFRTPTVARVDVPASSGWEAIGGDVQLANTSTPEGR